MKKLSIVITRHNEDLAVLRQLLDSLNRQTFKDLEVIVSDDGHSAPDISQIIDEYEFPIYHVESDKMTVSHARNVGFRMCDAKYMMFCDCDDMFCDEQPDGLELAIDKMDKDSAQVLRSFIKIEMPRKAAGHLSAIQTLTDNDEIVTVSCGSINASAVHGKIFDVGFARSANAEFCDDLSVNEESPFVNYLYIISERKYDMTCPFYVWKYNAKSVTRTMDLYPVNGLDSYAKAAYCEYEKIIAYDNANSTRFFDAGYITCTLMQQYYWLEHLKCRFVGHSNFNLYYDRDIAEISRFFNRFKQYHKQSYVMPYAKIFINLHYEIFDITEFTAGFNIWLDDLLKQKHSK